MQRRSFIGGLIAGLAALCGWKLAVGADVPFGRQGVAKWPDPAKCVFLLLIGETNEVVRFYDIQPSIHEGWRIALAKEKSGQHWRACYRAAEGGVDIRWMKHSDF